MTVKRHFAQLEFGPWALRPLLREILEPGERVIGWATAREQASSSLSLLRIGLAIMPGMGQVLALAVGAIFGPPRVLLLLTDARLLMLDAKPSGPGMRVPHLLCDFGLSTLRIKAGTFRTGFAMWGEDDRERRFDVEPRGTRPSQTLWKAIAIMDPEAAARAGLSDEADFDAQQADLESERVPAWATAPSTSARKRGDGGASFVSSRGSVGPK